MKNKSNKIEVGDIMWLTDSPEVVEVVTSAKFVHSELLWELKTYSNFGEVVTTMERDLDIPNYFQWTIVKGTKFE